LFVITFGLDNTSQVTAFCTSQMIGWNVFSIMTYNVSVGTLNSTIPYCENCQHLVNSVDECRRLAINDASRGKLRQF